MMEKLQQCIAAPTIRKGLLHDVWIISANSALECMSAPLVAAGNQMDVPEVVPDMLEEQVVAGNGGNRLDVVIANGGIQPQMLSSQITYDWLHKHF